MRSSRYASLTRLVIGASIIAGLTGTTASVALAVSPATTFGIVRLEDPHNGVQTTDEVYRSTDTITGTGDLAAGFTVEPRVGRPHGLPGHHGADRRIALAKTTYTQIDATPTTVKPGAVLTVDGTACVSGPALPDRSPMSSSRPRTSRS